MKIRKFKIKIQSGEQFREDVIGKFKAAQKRKLHENGYDMVRPEFWNSRYR